MEQKNCNHTTTVYVDVEDTKWDSYLECHVDVTRRERREESLFRDIDTHRLKCSRCGKIEYYSKAAKDFFEKGIPSDIVQYFNKKR